MDAISNLPKFRDFFAMFWSYRHLFEEIKDNCNNSQSGDSEVATFNQEAQYLYRNLLMHLPSAW